MAAVGGAWLVLLNQQHVQRTRNQTQIESTIHVNGFIVDSSQKALAQWIFKTYPETAMNVQSQNPCLRTDYMNVLFDIFGTLYHMKSRDISDARLSKVSRCLSDLTQAGFNVEWLRPKLEKISLERKKRKACEARIVELKEEVKKLELMMSGLKVELKNEKAKLKKL